MRRPESFVLPVLVLFLGQAGAQDLSRGASGSDVALYGRLLAMTDTRSLDTALVGQALSSDWSPLRAAAALAIGQIGSERGMAGAPRLRALLSDSDTAVSANAAYALGLLRDSGSIAAISSAVDGPQPVAVEAAWALGEIGAAGRASVVSLLRRTRSPAVSTQLLLAAAKMRPVPIAEIRPYLKSRSLPVTWAAAYALARTRTPGGVRDLISLEMSPAVRSRPHTPQRAQDNTAPYLNPTDPSALVRAEIARGLAKSAAGDSLRSQALVTLARLARDERPHVRVNALRSLSTYGAAAKNEIIRAIRDRDPNVRIAAAQALSTTISRDADFASLWAADTATVYRASLLASAASAGLRPRQLRRWASSADWHHRAAAASAAGDTSDRAFAIARGVGLIGDPDPRVREAAYGALLPAASMPLEDTVHKLLVGGLRDSDFYVRATVLGALAERPAASDLSAVLDSYRLALRDSANDARLASLQYIAAVWKKDSVSVGPEVRSRLGALPVPADPLERLAGKAVPILAHWAAVQPVPRPMSWYDSVVRLMILPMHSGRPIRATINTARGAIRLELFGDDAPITVWNFLSLARSGYYRNTHFHRVVPNFVAQDGDPRDDGNGGPGYAIRDEMNRHRYERGALGMALSGPDTGGSQYFITHSPQPHLDGHYTVFGRVLSGYDVLDRIVQGDLITGIVAQ